MDRRSNHRGFTIIEMLVSLVIFSMIMLATLTAMRTFGESQSRIEQHTDRLDEMRQATSLLRSLVGKAIPVTAFVEEKGIYNTFFYGNEEQLVWIAPLVTGAGSGGVYFFRLALQDEVLGLQMVAFRSASEPPQWDGIEVYPLLRSVESIDISYLADLEPATEWQSEWAMGYFSPKLVRLNLKVRGKYWPETVIRLDNGMLRQ